MKKGKSGRNIYIHKNANQNRKRRNCYGNLLAGRKVLLDVNFSWFFWGSLSHVVKDDLVWLLKNLVNNAKYSIFSVLLSSIAERLLRVHLNLGMDHKKIKFHVRFLKNVHQYPGISRQNRVGFFWIHARQLDIGSVPQWYKNSSSKVLKEKKNIKILY